MARSGRDDPGAVSVWAARFHPGAGNPTQGSRRLMASAANADTSANNVPAISHGFELSPRRVS